MPKRGEILVERLTGKRVIVIHVVNADEVTCRFADGRLEDRFTFELERVETPSVSALGAMASFFFAPLMSRPRDTPPAAMATRVRPLIVRQS